jgi:hypothetical protein
MAKTTTDPRYAAARFKGFPAPRKVSAAGGAPADATTRQRVFAESARRQNYRHPVTVGKSRQAREE